MCLPNRATENKRDKQITPQTLMGRKRRRKRVCAGGLEGLVCLLCRWGVVRSFQAGERDLMEQRLADKVVAEPRETAPQPLIPQYLWMSGEQTRKGHLVAGR